jgi:chromosome segregation ATPase
MNRNLSISSLSTLLFVFLFAVTLPANAANDKKNGRIKKCQDAAGKWHYGDNADEDCARSKVIELDTRGIQRKEIAAPLTEAELKAREQNREQDEQARKLAAEQQRRDQQLLATYAIEEDIVLTRDRKIKDIEAQIHASQETLKSLQTSLTRLKTQAADEQRGGKPVSPQTAKTIANNEAQIAKHQAYVEKMKKDQDTMRTQYQTELERFRELKRKPLPAAPATATTAAPAQKK